MPRRSPLRPSSRCQTPKRVNAGFDSGRPGAGNVWSSPEPRYDGSKVGQQIRFCTAPDGARLAYAVHGSGPPIVRVATWLTHLEFDWESPVWRHWLEGLGAGHSVVRYDERGCGLSDREVGELSVDAWVGDLEAIVGAAGLDRFALLGVSQGAAIALACSAPRRARPG